MILRVDPDWFLAAVIAAKEQAVQTTTNRDFRLEVRRSVYANLTRHRVLRAAVANAGTVELLPGDRTVLVAGAWEVALGPDHPSITARIVILADTSPATDPLTAVRFDLSGLDDHVVAVPGAQPGPEKQGQEVPPSTTAPMYGPHPLRLHAAATWQMSDGETYSPDALSFLADYYERQGLAGEAGCIRSGMPVDHESHVALKALSDFIRAKEARTVAENAGEDPHERGYIEGRRAFARELAQLVRGELGALGKSLSNLEAERDEARSVLRRLCEDHGDNDWDDDLHLADALDKHLGRYLDE